MRQKQLLMAGLFVAAGFGLGLGAFAAGAGSPPDGDLNQDALVDGEDVRLLADWLAGNRVGAPVPTAEWDRDGDGRTTPVDLLLLQIRAALFTAVVCVDDDNLTGVEDGSPAHPFRSLQAALDATSATGATVKAAVGCYRQNLSHDNSGRHRRLVGGFPGGTEEGYRLGRPGDFTRRTADPAATHLCAVDPEADVVRFLRFSEAPMSLLLEGFRITGGRRGVSLDAEQSWPHLENVIVAGNLVEDNGSVAAPDAQLRGAGVGVSGTNVTLRGNTIRNNRGGRGAGIGRVSTPVNLWVAGNRVENNHCYSDHGGGVCLDGDVQFEGNLIRGNRVEMGYGWGGGLLLLGTARLSGDVVEGNFAPSYAGGIFVDEGAAVELDHVLVTGNRSDRHGAGIGVDDGEPGPSRVRLTHCTVADNPPLDPDEWGGNGLYLDNRASAEVRDSIFWGNGDDFYLRPESSSALAAAYTLSQEPLPGTGNRVDDPLFADAAAGDYHLQSTAGRFVPHANGGAGGWVADARTSPAVDAGDPASDYARETIPNGGRANLGVHGNTAEASRSPAKATPQAP